MLIHSTPSTNSAAREILATTPLPHGAVVYTHCQTAGRGQRGNSWEAEPGKNVTMSLVLRPTDIRAVEQFRISEAVALAVAQVVTDCGAKATVKWPNDIYVADNKIAGILIENSLSGATIDWSIAGIGLNVNQVEFLSDAPNPTSLALLTGRTYPLDDIIAKIRELTLHNLTLPPCDLHATYLQNLWRREGYHTYEAPELGRFEAQIVDIAPDGMLTLAQPDGTRHTFAFKEVSAVL